MLELNGVYAGYYGTVMLKNICLTLKDSKITGIIGPNGCGKSTLLRVTAGLMRPISGSVLLDGKETGEIGRLEFARRVSFLPQVRSVPNMSVSALVMHGRHPYLTYPRRYSAADRRAVLEAMELTGAIKYRDRNLAGLSGGERQKAYIAMSVAQDTDVLLLDEPTTYLDIHHQFEIMELMETLRSRGKLIVIVLHDLNMALRYCDVVAVMQQGEILSCGQTGELCKNGRIDAVFNIQTEPVRSNGALQLLINPKEKIS